MSPVLRMPSAPARFMSVAGAEKDAAIRDVAHLAHVTVRASRALNTLSIASAAFCVARSSFGESPWLCRPCANTAGHAKRADGQHTGRDERLDE